MVDMGAQWRAAGARALDNALRGRYQQDGQNMRDPLDFDDAGADDSEPVKGVTVGDVRAWHDEMSGLRDMIANKPAELE